jgi:arginase family enzyme
MSRNRLCYLTIELDVLSAEAIAEQLSTPAGPGLKWSELLKLIGCVVNEPDVIAGAIVELNQSTRIARCRTNGAAPHCSSR